MVLVSDNKYILVTGGYPKSQAVKTEVIDATDPTQTCFPLANFPTGEYWMPTGGVIDGKIVVCQGDGGQKCFELQDNEWSEFATLAVDRYVGSGTVINDALFLYSGISNSNEPFSEYVYSDGTTKNGPNLYLTGGNKDFGM